MIAVERVFHPFNKWEDFKWGMYEKVCYMDPSALVRDCEMQLKSPGWLLESMTFVSYEWPFAAEQHLTNRSRNRRAWLGQAACCMMQGAPEYITKLAWNNLNETEQASANQVADEVLEHWLSQYSQGRMPWQSKSS